jgi:hypothetical protein
MKVRKGPVGDLRAIQIEPIQRQDGDRPDAPVSHARGRQIEAKHPLDLGRGMLRDKRLQHKNELLKLSVSDRTALQLDDVVSVLVSGEFAAHLGDVLPSGRVFGRPSAPAAIVMQSVAERRRNQMAMRGSPEEVGTKGLSGYHDRQRKQSEKHAPGKKPLTSGAAFARLL